MTTKGNSSIHRKGNTGVNLKQNETETTRPFKRRGYVKVNIFVQTQPILKGGISLASHYNSLSEYV